MEVEENEDGEELELEHKEPVVVVDESKISPSELIKKLAVPVSEPEETLSLSKLLPKEEPIKIAESPVFNKPIINNVVVTNTQTNLTSEPFKKKKRKRHKKKASGGAVSVPNTNQPFFASDKPKEDDESMWSDLEK